MDQKQSIKFFQNQKVRTKWNANQEKWYFSVVDVIKVLTESRNPRNYWNMLKKRELEHGIELSTFCVQQKLQSSDGKFYTTDTANTESLFRIIQSIPSKKAEPFKLWLARVGYERIEENQDPELAINRAMRTYLAKGYSKEWINQRLKSIEIRKELTDEWEERGVKEAKEFAILTKVLTKAWSGKSVKEYKQFKDLKKESLRDNMSNMELVLNMLAEASTTEISMTKKPETFRENHDVAKSGGNIAGNARKELEKQTKKSIINSENNFNLEKKNKAKKSGNKLT
jgi:hypothetical protein